MILTTEIYAVTLGQALAALSPSIMIAALFNPFFLVLFSVFCGVTAPPATLPYFWRVWMYQLDPFTRLVSGLVSTGLHEVPVQCQDSEFSVFCESPLPIHLPGAELISSRALRPDMRFIRQRLCPGCRRLHQQPERHERLPILPVLSRRFLLYGFGYLVRYPMARLWHLCRLCRVQHAYSGSCRKVPKVAETISLE